MRIGRAKDLFSDAFMVMPDLATIGHAESTTFLHNFEVITGATGVPT